MFVIDKEGYGIRIIEDQIDLQIEQIGGIGKHRLVNFIDAGVEQVHRFIHRRNGSCRFSAC